MPTPSETYLPVGTFQNELYYVTGPWIGLTSLLAGPLYAYLRFSRFRQDGGKSKSVNPDQVHDPVYIMILEFEPPFRLTSRTTF